MKTPDAEEKIYYDDSQTKITASFIAGYKKIILPVARVKDVIVTHKAFSLYSVFLICVVLILLLFLSPMIPPIGDFEIPTDKVWFFFIPCFGACCIWLRFIYENYVELYIELDDGTRHPLRVITLGKRTVVYDIADAARAALQDYRTRTREQELQDTDSLRIRRLRNMLVQSNLDMTPEILSLLDTRNMKKRSR